MTKFVIDNGKNLFESYDKPEIDAIAATKAENFLIGNAAGNIATFETNLADELQSLKCEINASGGNGSPDSPIPIVGHSELNLTRCGVNLLDGFEISSREVNGITITNNGDGTYTFNGTATADVVVGMSIPLDLPVGDYMLSGTPTGHGYNCFMDCYGTDMGNKREYGNGIVFTFNGNPLTVRMGIANGETINNELYKPMISVGSVKPAFKAYNGTPFTVAFGQTVYGGVYDKSGRLTITWVGVDMGSLTWQVIEYQGISYKTSNSIASTVKAPTLSSETANIKCPIFKNVSRDELDNFNYVICIDPNKTIDIIDNDYSTAADFTNAMNGIILAYELETPIEVDLTAAELSTIIGKNNVFHNCNGQIAVSYKDTIQHYIDSRLNALSE